MGAKAATTSTVVAHRKLSPKAADPGCDFNKGFHKPSGNQNLEVFVIAPVIGYPEFLQKPTLGLREMIVGQAPAHRVLG